MRIACGLLAATLVAGGSHAQPADIEPIAPRPVPAPDPGELIEEPFPEEAAPDIDREAVLVGSLTGILFSADPQRVARQPRADIQGIVIEGMSPPAAAAFRQRFEPYLRQPVTLGLLDRINREVVRHYREHDVLVVDAFAPQGQDITDGVVQVVVLVGRLGRVRVEGAEHFPAERLAAQIRLERGDALSRETLQEDIAWLNNNPFRSVNLMLERGEEFGETDLVLSVTDRTPFRAYVGAEDTGTALTGKRRWLAGFNWGNAFGGDQQLNYQFTSSSEFGEMKAHTLSYLAPLPWRHTISVFGAHVSSEPPPTPGGFQLTGTSWQLGARYNLPFRGGDGLRHGASLGLDFKRSNNDLEFGSVNVFATYTNIVQFVAAYNINADYPSGTLYAGATLHMSPGGFGDANGDAAFDAARSGARANYFYGSFNLGRMTRLPGGFTWVADLQFQGSTRNLLGSEQIGIGGYRSVRGYDEYQATGDKGLILRNEIRTPARAGNAQFLAFLDHGIVDAVERLPGETSTTLRSAGIGLRYAYSPYVTVRADYGRQLKEAVPGAGKGSRGHFSIVVGY